MNRGDAVSGVLLLAVGIYGAVNAYGFGLGTFSQPGPGFFPFLAGALVAGCAGAVAIRALSAKWWSNAVEHIQASPNAAKAAPAVAALVAYAVALPLIGFVLSTFLIMMALSRLDATTTWAGSVTLAGLGALGFWLVFVRILGVNFPATLITA